MTANRELFVEDPTEHEIPNLGVAKVLIPESEVEFNVLRWELSHFVCDGEYANGLQRILESYLRNLDQNAQPAVWVERLLRQREVPSRAGPAVPVDRFRVPGWKHRAGSRAPPPLSE